MWHSDVLLHGGKIGSYFEVWGNFVSHLQVRHVGLRMLSHTWSQSLVPFINYSVGPVMYVYVFKQGSPYTEMSKCLNTHMDNRAKQAVTIVTTLFNTSSVLHLKTLLTLVWFWALKKKTTEWVSDTGCSQIWSDSVRTIVSRAAL